MKYKVSIIIPVFNVEDYLKNALDSIINQTMNFSDIQVILVDDASEDNSGRIIDYYCKKYDNFHGIHLKNNSGSAAKPRNIALKEVQSDYVMFLDPDDEFELDYCEVMYDAITNYDLNLVKTNIKLIIDDEEHINYYFEQNIDKKIITTNDEPLSAVSICNGIHKYDFIVKNNLYFPNNSFGEDIFFSVNEFLTMEKMLYLNNYFGYKYFNRKGSHAKSSSIENVCSVLKVFYLTRDLCIRFEREDVLNLVLGNEIAGIYMRIINVKGLNNKVFLLKKVYGFIKSVPNLIISSEIYKIANILLIKRLFYFVAFYLTLLNYLNKSTFFVKVYRFFNRF